MRLLVLVFVLALLALGLWLVWSSTRADADDVPEVALAKQGLPAYARAQHERAQKLEALLGRVRAEDDVMPSLSQDLRRQIDEALR